METRLKQNQGILILVSIGLLAGLISWIIPSYDAKDYIKLVESGSSELTVTKTFDDVSFHLSLRPPGYLALKSLDDKELGRRAFNEVLDGYKSTSHYVLRMEKDGGGSLLKDWAGSNENYQYLINYLAFDVKNDFKLMGQLDTFECQFVHFERNFDLAPFAQLQVGFNTPEHINPMIQDDEWLVEFNAEQLGLGPLKFRFENNKLIKNPSISF